MHKFNRDLSPMGADSREKEGGNFPIKQLSVAHLSLPGLSSATMWFEPGREYQFSYEGKMMTGLPQMSNHFSGVVVRSEVVVQAVDQTNYKIKVRLRLVQ